MLAIHLNPTELPAGLSLRLGSRQAIVKHELTDDLYRAKLEESLSEYVIRPADTETQSESRKQINEDHRVYASMAVLPFENRSTEPDLTSFGETLGEEITHLIGSVWNGHRLIGGTETLRYAVSSGAFVLLATTASACCR